MISFISCNTYKINAIFFNILTSHRIKQKKISSHCSLFRFDASLIFYHFKVKIRGRIYGPKAKAAWLRGYSGRLRTERSWVQNPHMLPPLDSQGDVVVPCKPELSGWRSLARVRGHAW